MHTLAISSLFLNSPLTSVTLPFSSSSVHRSFNSLVGRVTRPNPCGPPLSSRKLASGGACSLFGGTGFRWLLGRQRLHALFCVVDEKVRV